MKHAFFRRQMFGSMALFGYMAVPVTGQTLPLSFNFPKKSRAAVTERVPHWIKVQIKVETGATSNTDEFEYEFKWVLKQ